MESKKRQFPDVEPSKESLDPPLSARRETQLGAGNKNSLFKKFLVRTFAAGLVGTTTIDATAHQALGAEAATHSSETTHQKEVDIRMFLSNIFNQEASSFTKSNIIGNIKFTYDGQGNPVAFKESLTLTGLEFVNHRFDFFSFADLNSIEQEDAMSAIENTIHKQVGIIKTVMEESGRVLLMEHFIHEELVRKGYVKEGALVAKGMAKRMDLLAQKYGKEIFDLKKIPEYVAGDIHPDQWPILEELKGHTQ